MKILKNNITINRPMVFLCGPYYEEKAHDRRKILKDFLTSKNKVIPIIVDKFLDKKNIKDDSINIDLIEEICAAVSYKTYIFLDTFSSVAELGMFSSRVYQNQIDVIIPKKADIISNNIGFFIREIIENINNDKIQCLYYSPRIVRVPLASEYVTEYFEFTNNELPQNIKTRISSDNVYNINDYKVTFTNDNNVEKSGTINYYQSGSKISFTLSIRMLFYLVASILLEKKDSVSEWIVDDIEIELNELIINSFCFYENKDILDFSDVQINTKILSNIKDVIKHILEFIKLYNDFGDSKGRHIITKQDSFIKEINSFEYFAISPQNRDLISEYLNTPNNFIETIKIRRGKKIRNITKYKDDEKGSKLRQLHELVLNKLQRIYCFSDNSYAYRKGFSILDCVKPHKKSISFLKVDIKNFFNSIENKELFDYSKEIVSKFFVVDRDYKNLIKACMHNNKLPLGLITSPILSDMYLHEFDKNIINLLNLLNKKIIFTRYADDMYFSCEEEIDKNDLDYIINSVREELLRLNLQINDEKTVYKKLVSSGDHMKILGINVVKTNTENELTVGKKFINDTCKMYFEYLNNKCNNENSEKSKFYTEKRLSGRVAYIMQIEGEIGFEKFKTRIFKSTKHKVLIPNHKIDWGYLIEIETESAG